MISQTFVLHLQPRGFFLVLAMQKPVFPPSRHLMIFIFWYQPRVRPIYTKSFYVPMNSFAKQVMTTCFFFFFRSVLRVLVSWSPQHLRPESTEVLWKFRSNSWQTALNLELPKQNSMLYDKNHKPWYLIENLLPRSPAKLRSRFHTVVFDMFQFHASPGIFAISNTLCQPVSRRVGGILKLWVSRSPTHTVLKNKTSAVSKIQGPSPAGRAFRAIPGSNV